MKKILIFAILLIISLSFTTRLIAGGCKLKYLLKPGQKWLGTLSNHSETNPMEKKKISRSKTKIEYLVLKSHKKAWVKLQARILSTGKKSSRIDLSKILYSADVHESGEIRNITYSGDFMPDLGERAAKIPKETLEMMKQSFKMIPEFWKNTAYWFPEVPEDKIEIGDEFECKRKMGIGTAGKPMQIQSVVKQVFTLEDVSKGLAYFSVQDRSVTKGTAMGIANSKTRMAGKGEAIFDLEQGMWLELTEKSKTKIALGNAAGPKGKNHDMRIIFKYEMELLSF